MAGNTKSSDFPTTRGAYDTSQNGGDAFVLKLDNELTNLLTSTFLGGSGSDVSYSLGFDASGNVYLSGGTKSSDFPTTLNACDTSYNGNSDVFISKFDSNLSAGVATPTPTPTPTPVQIDTTQPVGSININSGASYTNTRTVTLNLTATDDVGVTGYYVSNSFSTPAVSDSGWKSISSTTDYSADISYTLISVDGANTLYAWFKDAAGNVSDTASGSITLVTATTSTPTPTSTVTPEPTSTQSDEDLLEKYAPILYMHSEERLHPTNVEVMLENSELYEKKNLKDKRREKSPTLKMLMNDYNDDKYYLKLKNKAAKKAKKKEWKERQTVYARQIDLSEETSVLQYWFFYVYNDWGGTTKGGNKHEGDWEMIQIILKNKQPEHITYSIHEGGLELSWDSIEEIEDTHPIVYATKGGHGSWNKAGNHTWYQQAECLRCTDETDNKGDILYPESMSDADKYSYTIEKMSDWNDENNDWIYWKGYWGKQTMEKDVIDIGNSGPQSPPYVDYINEVEEGEKSQNGRWYDPISWGYNPNPVGYVICNSTNSKIIAYDEEENVMQLILQCSVAGICGYCSEIKAIYTNKDLQFEVYSLDGEEVTLKISRYNRDTKEVHEVEFDWLDIPKNGKATLTFSPKKNPDFEVKIDNDLDNVIDRTVMPDYSTQYQR